MPFTDSVDKIISTYFKAVTKESFTYKGVIYDPMPLSISPLLLRGFTCPAGCGGCCPRFSLDYIPAENKPQNTILRQVAFNNNMIDIYSDLQDDHKNHHCRNLNMTDGRCGIYQVRPFSCDFELIRFFIYDDRARLSQQLFGRGWSFLKIDLDDNNRGALCTMLPPDPSTIQETIRKLNRLSQWATHFGLITWVPEIINWIYSGDTTKNLKLGV